ncbi:MAG TPA: MDR family MFS transporter [Burkholderiaceae bacterium]|nr:MDR family MFS transporter [Burkholderiaceae bacterium]
MNQAPTKPQTFSHAEVRSIIIGLMLAILLGALDQTIVSVALPMMSADLGGVDLLAWVVSGYLITVAVATPIYGKLGDLYGRRVMLTSAITIFLLSSIGSAMAPSMPFLVGARILQGLGGGGLISVAQAIIADVVAPRERGRYQGYISAAFAVASVSGPLLGGFLTSYLSWRWVFWINLPLGAAAMFISRRALARLHTPRIKRPVDYPGAILMTVALSPLLIGITRVGQGSPWMDELNVWLFGGTLVAIALFLWQETRATEPIVPLGLFRNPTVSLSCTLMFIAFILIVSLSVLIPLRAQMLLGAQADQAALLLLPFSLGIPVGAYVGGRMSAFTGRFKRIQLCGAVCTPIAMLGLVFVDAHATGANLVCVGVIGFTIGLQLPTSTVAVQNAVESRHMGIATAVIAFCRSLGAAIGIAVLMAVLMATLQAMAPATAGGLSGPEIIKSLIDQAASAMDALVRADLVSSVDDAFRKVFALATATACVSILLSLLMRDEELGDTAPAAAD